MRTLGVADTAPSLAFCPGVGKIQEPVRVEAFAPDGLGMSVVGADLLKHAYDVSGGKPLTRHDRRHIARVRVDHGQGPQAADGVKLVVNEAHRPDLVGRHRVRPSVAQLRLHFPLRGLVPKPSPHRVDIGAKRDRLP